MADAPAEPAAKHPGERLASYFENFFKTIVGIATLGASITFAKIVQSPVPPFHPYGFTTQSIQYLLATSWLLFALTLGFTSFLASALSLWRPLAITAFGTANSATRTKVLWISTFVSATLFGLTLAAFLTLELVVVAYAGPVGWVAVGFTGGFGAAGFATIAWQSPLEWPVCVGGRGEGGWGGGEEDAFGRHMRLQGRKERGNAEDVLTGEGGGKEGANGQGQERVEVPRRRQGQENGQGYGQQGYGDEKSGRAAVGGRYDDEKRGSGGRDGGFRRASRQGGEAGGYEYNNRYSRASTVLPEYDAGRYGQGGYVYDNRVREGLVMGDFSDM